MVQEWKKQKAKELKTELEKAKILGMVDLDLLPSKQLQTIKKSIKKEAKLLITKKSLLKKAFEGTKQEKLFEKVGRMPAIILTEDNPFKLFKILKKNQSDSFAKAGQESPKDITIPAGPTDFGPGPMISEFASMGIKTKIDKGKIAIQNDAVVVKKGEIITPLKASFLQKMGVKPMKIGINLVAVYDNGTIFTKEILDIDEEQVMQDFITASQHAFNLSVESEYYTNDNITIFLQKAGSQARNLGMEANIYDKELIEDILRKAHGQATNLM